jgi:hypothetical protein
MRTTGTVQEGDCELQLKKEFGSPFASVRLEAKRACEAPLVRLLQLKVISEYL